MSVSDFFASIFRDDTEETVATMRSRAGEIVLAEQTPYVQRLLEYLDDEADKPIRIGDAQIIESAVRANTFKEIRAKLRREFKEAHAILDEARHGNS